MQHLKPFCFLLDYYALGQQLTGRTRQSALPYSAYLSGYAIKVLKLMYETASLGLKQTIVLTICGIENNEISTAEVDNAFSSAVLT